MRSSSRSAVAGLLAIVASVVVAVLATTRGPAPVAAAQDAPSTPRSGAEIWSQDCAICHGTRGEGSFQGPPIDQAGTASVDFMVRTGRMPAPSPGRPPRELFSSSPPVDRSRQEPAYDEQEIRALVQYTAGFVEGPAAPGPPDLSQADVATGGELYRLNCSACHQMAGSGGALAYGTIGPSLGASDGLDVVEAMRTGPGNMPVFDRTVLDDEQARDIAAYVQYLHDPQDRGGSPLWHLGPVPEGLVAWVVGVGGLLLLCRWLGERERVGTE
jgi:ubiquinol-cytochrome c reductase cytochrome c subunit